MMKKRLLSRLKFYFWVALFAAYSIAAAGVMINALVSEPYGDLSQVAATTVDSPLEVRMGGATQVAAVYRAQSGTPFSTLPPGSTFKIVWPDGSSEYVTVVSQSSAAGVRLIPGTQRAAPESAPAHRGELQVVPLEGEAVPEDGIELR